MSAVEVAQLPGKGRGLVTTRKIEAGEIVLSEEPLLLTVSQDAKDYACANCMCWLERCPGAVACQSCRQASFCSAACQQQAAAKPWVHAEATCRAYAAIPLLVPTDLEAQTNLRFLIQAAAMKAAAAAAIGGSDQQQPSGYSVLMSLTGDASAASLQQAAVLQPALCQAIGDSSSSLLQQQEVAALLVKEQINSYGLLAPIRHQQPATTHTNSTNSSSEDCQPATRALRGGALFPTCALINHECLPNVARFEAWDAAVEGNWPSQWPGRGASPADAGLNAVQGASAATMPGSSSSSVCSTTRVVLRALHELPAGTEIVQSYFPLNWDYDTRQEQAQQVYGFTCRCPRCVLESSPEWQAGDDGSEGDWETDSDTDAATLEDTNDQHMHDVKCTHQQQQETAASNSSLEQLQQQQQQQQQPEALDPGYLSVFILKYMCPQDGCCGVMAAVAGASMCECSVCGFTRTDEQFLAELEQ